MTSLLACLSTGKGTWTQVNGIINSATWDNVFLITNDFGKTNYKSQGNAKLLVFNLNKHPDILSDEIVTMLRAENLGPEVAINLTSGNGDEHMAILAAVLKLGLGVRLVFFKDGKVEELKLFNFSFD